MVFADATSGGQLGSTALTVADSDTTNTKLVRVANSFFILRLPFVLG
jgi:hypothetical protein